MNYLEYYATLLTFIGSSVIDGTLFLMVGGMSFLGENVALNVAEREKAGNFCFWGFAFALIFGSDVALRRLLADGILFIELVRLKCRNIDDQSKLAISRLHSNLKNQF